MSQFKPIVTASRVEAYAASALRVLCWLLGVILRLNPASRSIRLKHVLGRAEAAVECVLFLEAVALYGPPPRRRHHPRSVAYGFRRVENRRMSLFFRGAKIRARKAKPLTRVLALIEALMRPQRAVAHFFKQICKGLHIGRLTPVAPPGVAIAVAAFSADHILTDTS